MFLCKTQENKGSQSCLYLHVVTIYKYTCRVSPVPKLSWIPGNDTTSTLTASLPLPQERGRDAPPRGFIFTQGLSWSTWYEPSRPLKVGDEHHEALQGPCDVLASDPVTSSLLCRGSGAERHGGQQLGSPALPVSGAACVPSGAGGPATRSQACSDSSKSPGRALCPASVPFRFEEVSEASLLGLCFSEPTQTL